MENSRIHERHFFTTSDNTALFYPALALQRVRKRSSSYSHRGHEHSGRLQHIVDELTMPDTAFMPGMPEGMEKRQGRVVIAHLLRVQFRMSICPFAASDSQVGLEEVVVIAQSVGAVLVATWVHDYTPAIRGLVLATPAFKVKLYAAGVLRWRYGIVCMVCFINSYVKGRYLTHDRQRVASFNNDPLITWANCR